MNVVALSVKPVFRSAAWAFVIALILIFVARQGAWASDHVLYVFTGGNNGSGPNDLIADKAGNLFGTTFSGGGPAGAGTVFRLSPPVKEGDAWTETVLYSFSFAQLQNGIGPKAGLVMDPSGNMFGSTWLGGPTGGGLVFELSPPAAGGSAWTFQILYDFSASNDGSSPQAPLARDAAGNLYGTTVSGGIGGCFGGCGIVFKLTPPVTGSGMWTETILYNFPGSFPQGGGTLAGVTLDAKGAVYGTTTFEGGGLNGTVFRLSPPKTPGGRWTHSVLYAFQGGDDGSTPTSKVVFDKQGNLYGVTALGGVSAACFGVSCGTVFKLTPTRSGPWKHTVLHTFGGGEDGGNPMSGVTLGAVGDIFGTTQVGGSTNCGGVGCGTIYRLHLESSVWTETILDRFLGGLDGVAPGGLVFGKRSALYGATGGGLNFSGLIFTVLP